MKTDSSWCSHPQHLMENINRIFKRFDLDQYFTAKLSGADLKASKPHPEIFINAAEALWLFKVRMYGD